MRSLFQNDLIGRGRDSTISTAVVQQAKPPAVSTDECTIILHTYEVREE